MSWIAVICPECGSEITCELKDDGEVEEKCTNPDCPSNNRWKRVREKNSGEKQT